MAPTPDHAVNDDLSTLAWVADEVRRSLEVLADRGTDVAEFDGHVSDPHFLPVWTRLSPDGRWFHLVEVPADGPG